LLDFGRSNQTANHYRAALRAFLRWARKRGRIRDNPMDCVESLAEQDPEHPRRALTDDELARLIEAAATGPELFGMTGPLRAIAYKTAALTGFRVSELRSLMPESFRLGGAEPTVFLRRSSTKNRKPADQPIPLALARELCDWLGGRPSGASVFPLSHETAKAIRADLEAAGVPFETEEGKADFHSLRAYYTSSLIHAGASVAEFQKLARHAKAETTLKHYAKVAPHNLRGAVEMLPSLTAPAPEALPATGTAGFAHQQTLAPHLIHSGDVFSRLESLPDVMAETTVRMAMSADSLEKEASDASVRSRTPQERRGGDSNPRGRLTPPNGLANRRFRPLSHLSRRFSRFELFPCIFKCNRTLTHLRSRRQFSCGSRGRPRRGPPRASLPKASGGRGRCAQCPPRCPRTPSPPPPRRSAPKRAGPGCARPAPCL
jgi:integrase